MNIHHSPKYKFRFMPQIKAMGFIVIGLMVAIVAVKPNLVSAQTPPLTPRIYAQLTDDSLRFEYSTPGDMVTYSIYDAPNGNLLWEESRTADDSGFTSVGIWEHRVDLKPGMYVTVSDSTASKDLLLEVLSLDEFNPDQDILAGTAVAERTVWAVANNETTFCGTEVTTDENGEWIADFQSQGCDVTNDMVAYVQVFDADEDTTEAVPAFIDGFHDYDRGDVPNWACNAGGWAIDTDDRDRDLAIRVLSDGEEVATTIAGNSTDLIGICGADGTCGYEVSLWDLITPYEDHQITVQAYDQETEEWFDLNNTPMPLTCRTYDIYVFDRFSREIRQITDLRDSYEFNPRWSPNGKQIVHDRWDLDFNVHGVYITDVETGESTPLSGAESGTYPTWSPNGQWIAFDRDLGEGPKLYIVPPTGGEPRLLRDNAFMGSWAPNSRRLAYHQPSDGSIRTIDLDGDYETLVVERGNGPAWSPNGQWIAYEVDGDLWKIPVDIHGNPLGDPIQLTNEAAWEGRPSWSNNSHTITFFKGFDRDTDIWTISAWGGTASWLTGAPEFGDYDPNYSNNGRYVAYSSYSPDGQAARLWVAAYTYDLPAGVLGDGTYPYHFEFEWSSPETGSFSGQGGEFTVSGEAPLYDGYVLLRGPFELAGSDQPEGLVCEEVSEINPEQPMRFLIGWLGDQVMSYPEAQAHFSSITAQAVWGDNMSANLSGHEITPFSWDYIDYWFQNVCGYTRRIELPKQVSGLRMPAFFSGLQPYLPLIYGSNP